MTNHLARESSPYLLQHVDNPVDWYPWCEEALALAEKQNKPILLSIGYAACHWCHVMAHESFEDTATAELMNRWFVNIKVDREERPDLDSIYMSAVTSMTGHGGWPMTVFLTPHGKPFFSGTYFPPQPRYGMPAFRQVLSSIAEAWQSRQDEVLRSADSVTRHLHESLASSAPKDLHADVLQQAERDLVKGFDSEWGGFGSAPKFPQPMVLEFLLRQHLNTGDSPALGMLTLTLDRMAQGGMYDQLGGGFARYSTDERWLVPHFEKMLYDNAQLARIYLRAWQVTGDRFYRRITEETLDYVLREMRHEEGGFYSSQDADSEGEEGKFFVWSAAEVRQLLGADAERFMRVYDVTDQGNWEGKNILHLSHSASASDEAGADRKLQRCREKLLHHRDQRVWPGLDDKVLTAWNGLMLSAMAEAGRVLGREDYLSAATANATFMRRELRQADGRLLRTWKAGSQAKYNAYLEDYACLAEGLLALYEATFDHQWYTWALELAHFMLGHFRHPDLAGFFDTSDDHEQLIHRPRDVQDNAMPSGNAKAAMVLLRLGLYNGDGDFLRLAEESVSSVAEMMVRYPAGFGEWLNVASFMLGRPQEVALLGPLDKLDAMRAVINENFHPNLVVAAGSGGEIPLLAGRAMKAGLPAAYLCERFSCQAPVTSSAELRQLLAEK
jgi:uncharacterized protein YyaL (SSP411 family)